MNDGSKGNGIRGFQSILNDFIEKGIVKVGKNLSDLFEKKHNLSRKLYEAREDQDIKNVKEIVRKTDKINDELSIKLKKELDRTRENENLTLFEKCVIFFQLPHRFGFIPTFQNLMTLIQNENELDGIILSERNYIQAMLAYLRARDINKNTEKLWYEFLNEYRSGLTPIKEEKWNRLIEQREEAISFLDEALKKTSNLHDEDFKLDILLSISWHFHRRPDREECIERGEKHRINLIEICKEKIFVLASKRIMEEEDVDKYLFYIFQNIDKIEEERASKIVNELIQIFENFNQIYTISGVQLFWSISHMRTNYSQFEDLFCKSDKRLDFADFYCNSVLPELKLQIQANKNPTKSQPYRDLAERYKKRHNQIREGKETGYYLGKYYFFSALANLRDIINKKLETKELEKELTKTIQQMELAIEVSGERLQDEKILLLAIQIARKVIFHKIADSKDFTELEQNFRALEGLMWESVFMGFQRPEIVRFLIKLSQASSISDVKKIIEELEKYLTEKNQPSDIDNLVRYSYPYAIKSWIINYDEREKIEMRNEPDLINLYEQLSDIDDSNKKGRALEDFIAHVFDMIEGLTVIDIRKKLEHEEIDLIIKNDVNSTFWAALGSPMLFVECKNWTSKVGSAEVREFIGKIRNHKQVVRVGILISLNGFTKGASVQKRMENEFNIILIDGKELVESIEEMKNISEKFEELLIQKMIK